MKRPLQIFSYAIQNVSADEVDIHIDGDVVDASTKAVLESWFGDTTSTSYKSFRDQISNNSARVYNVIINSPGGHVGDALAIHDLLVDLQNKGKIVNTIGRGIVASSSTLILLAGNSPEMSGNSFFMMHTVSGGVAGSVDQVENYAITMRKFNDKIRDLYAEKSGMRKEEVTKLMDKETWLTAQEAFSKGLISKVTDSVEFTNRIEQDQWEYSDTSILNAYNQSVKPSNQTEDMKKLFVDLQTSIVNAVKAIVVTKDTDNQSLVNSVAEAVGNQFGNIGELMETQVTETVNNAVTEAFKNFDVKTSLKEDLERIQTLENRIQELEQDIVNKVGEQTNNKGGNAAKPVGSFS